MPTENRSSSTGMVSVPRDLLERATNNKYIDKERISIHRHEALFVIRGMLAQPSQQHQGEPVARVWWTPVQGRVRVDFIKGRLAEGTLLYTHTDPAEVERLQRKFDAYAESASGTERYLRAQLAEAQALLSRWVGKLGHLGGCCTPLREDTKALLSASVEPNNDLCAEGAHGFVPFRNDCVKCGAPYSAEPSAPVEKIKLYLNVSNVHVIVNPDGSYTINPVDIDERADFLDWANQEYEIGEGYELNESNVDLVQNWKGWQARAALERKP